ncbi:hypothetical protein FUT87_14895, partial [Mitsuaria sp. TWR114]|uniref:MBG domain-containing protein n=1 Tax=Mitsuaria sp. TWR114 TaxID=2601731 RepID=UPI0011C2DF13
MSYSGFVNGESASSLGGALSYGGTAQGAVNAGSYTLSAQGLSAANYAISYVPGTLTVNPATLTVSAGAASRLYGAADPVLMGSISGFVGGDTLASATTGSLQFSSATTAATPVGHYAVTGGGLTANGGNYVIVQAPGNATALSITPAPLTITANGASKGYDALAFAGGNGVTYSGFVNGETSSVLSGTLSYGGSAQGAVNAGSYGILPQGLSSGNYAVSFAPGLLTVTPASLLIAATPVSKTYDGTMSASGSPTVTGLMGSDSVSGLGQAFTDSSVGSGKTVAVQSGWAVQDGNGGNNYVVTVASSNSGVINAPAPAPAPAPA